MTFSVTSFAILEPYHVQFLAPIIPIYFLVSISIFPLIYNIYGGSYISNNFFGYFLLCTLIHIISLFKHSLYSFLANSKSYVLSSGILPKYSFHYFKFSQIT